MKKRNYLSILSLLFAALPLTSQTQAQYGILGRYPYEISDVTLLEEKVLPVSLREQIEKNRTQATPEELPASPLVLDKSRAVGTTIGTADVTPSGAATYQIPIEVPQGIAGLEPAVSVAYNSQAGNGLLGYGWYMSAFSAISRCGKTYYYDNAAEAPQLSNSDNLLLDNQRLLLVSGQNLVNGAKYRLEYDPTTEVAFKTVNSNSYFVVRTKEGITREFGSTADSHIEATGGNTLCWLLAKTTDQSGNTITYQYEEVPGNGEFYLTKIQYAGNRSIQFAYETRGDKQTTYFAGFPINNNKILKSLSTYIGQIQVKQYQFNYEKNGLYTQLTEVVEKGQNNEYYNSIKVNYGRGGVMPQEYISTLPEKREGSRPLFADFNGDGKTDFLAYPEKSSYTTSDVATLFVATQVFGDVNFSKQCTIPLQSSYATFQGLLLADLNGDGCMDVVNISKAADGTYRYNYYFFDGDKLTYTFKGFNTNGNEAFTGDFNGDGKYEILVKNNQKVFDGEGKEIASGGIDNWGSEFFQNYYPNNRYLCDFNGNGKTDLLVMDDESGWVYELNGKSFGRLNSFATSDLKNYYFPYFGDFNADGKTDVLIQNAQGDNYDDVHLLFSTGKGFIKQKVTNADIQALVQVADFNRDGKSDIFHMEVVNNAIRMKVGTFDGNSFTTSYYSTRLSPSEIIISPVDAPHLVPLEDFDGDGRAELCYARYTDAYVIHSFADDQNLLVQTITDGLGAQVSFQYAPITNGNVCSNTGNTATFPLTRNPYPLYVVSDLKRFGTGYNENISYRYTHPRLHVQGKGFLGFGEIEVSSDSKDRKVTTRYGYNGYYYPFVTEQKITTRAGANIFSSAYENSYVAQGGKRITPYIRQQTETDHLKGTTKTIECSATDTWGNPLTIVTRYGSDVTETLTSTYFNSETDNVWRIGLPLSKQKKTTRGSDNWIEKQTYTYNTRYLPEQRINYTSDGTKKVSEETFAYDSRGNIVTESVRTYASATLLTTRHEYSADGVFKTKTTDPMSLATTWTYNTLGQVVSSKDPLNNTTTYEYDGMGRLIRTTYPDQVSSTTTFTWESDVPNSVYAITETTTSKPTVKTYYDASDRELRKSIVRFDGSLMNSDKKYDNAGRIVQESFPFKGDAASQWNTYTYDGYGRLVQLAYASGNTETYAYSGTSITTGKDGIVSTRKYNAKGELVSVTDPAGSIVYTLRADGQPSRITAPGDVTTSFEYDEYGRRKTIVDPSAGRKTFTYDAAGYPKEEIDANNRKKVTTYDQYGRITLPAISGIYHHLHL